MKVFLSWSGTRSKAVAELLNIWIKCVLQATTPWISTRDIDRGALWFAEIGDQLRDTTIGIICLTQENKEKPWILFEAGALAKGLSSSRVCTLLIDLKPTDVKDPLAQFNHTLPDKDSIHTLVRTLNSALGVTALDDRVLNEVFETYWPQFETKFRDVLDSNKPTEAVKRRSDSNILEEILETTRHLSYRLQRVERQAEASSEVFGKSSKMSPRRSGLMRRIRELIDAGLPDDEIVASVRKESGLHSVLVRKRLAEARASDVSETIISVGSVD